MKMINNIQNNHITSEYVIPLNPQVDNHNYTNINSIE